MKAPETIETERLLLRRPKRSDAEAMFERYASHKEVTRFLCWPKHRAVTDTHAFIDFSDAEWVKCPAGPYLIISRTDGVLLGSIALTFETAYRAAVGYVLAKDSWGSGYATEALQAIVEVADCVETTRLYALVHPEQQASLRVLEKCKFTLEATLARYTEFPNLQPGLLADVLCYSRILE